MRPWDEKVNLYASEVEGFVMNLFLSKDVIFKARYDYFSAVVGGVVDIR